MTRVTAYVGADIHDGLTLVSNHALVVDADEGVAIRPVASIPEGVRVRRLKGGLITPGFVDLQVNGGGGLMFNDAPSVATLKQMAKAHTGLGTAGFLPTLITDTPDRAQAAIDAVEVAMRQQVDGIIGLHLEGPHISVARKGAHDPALIRPMEDADLAVLLRAAERLPNLMVTVAPENTRLNQITALAKAGIIVSLGHTDADYATCMAAFDAGATCVTHLFNAMSQLNSRAPGLVGAALDRDDVYAGLIADGIHVDPATIRLALAAKAKSDRIFLVSDAMAVAGSSVDRFTLNGREVIRRDGRLTLADGTLAGADLSLPRAVTVMSGAVGASLANSVTRATATPASLLRGIPGLGRIVSDTRYVSYIADLAAPESVERLHLSATADA